MHPSIASLLTYFEYEHLPHHLAEVSKQFHFLAHYLVSDEGKGLDGAEATACLRKLLESKDCAVRAALTKAAA